MQENNFFSKKGIGFDEYNSQLTLEAQQLADQLYEKNQTQLLSFYCNSFWKFY